MPVQAFSKKRTPDGLELKITNKNFNLGTAGEMTSHLTCLKKNLPGKACCSE
jgi:hypothetical protein